MFPKIAYGILFLFICMLIMTTVLAYSRRSGSTGQDMALAQKIRLEAAAEAKEVADAL